MEPEPTIGPDLRAALDDIAGIGPFFAASANPAEAVDDSWRPLRELYTDPQPLGARIRQVADALGGSDRRVAASIAYQGLVARLVSPVIAVASVHGLVPTWSPDTLHWRVSVVGPWPLWESECQPAAVARADDEDALAGEVVRVLLEPHLWALAAAVRRQASVSEQTLRGNAASSVVAAGRMVARARPASGARSARVVHGLLAAAWLRDAGTLGEGWAFRRNSCCLYYRVPGGGTCGDCVLR
jgi:ferric iron reductase protein FhuF